MHPVLLNLGSFQIHTYGVLIAIGFLVCIYFCKREAERIGISAERIIDLGFWSLLIGMFGSRVLFVITRWDYFSKVPIESFYVWQGGLVFWGGPLICIPFYFWYTKKFKLPRAKVLDIGAQAIPIAHAFGRMGCLSTGCCYGRPTGGDWGIKLYSDVVEHSLRGVYLHPTQIYEGTSLIFLFFVLRWVDKRKKFDGQTALAYLILYSIIRSIIEIFRGDTIRGFVIEDILSTSQFISIFVVIGALIVWKRKLDQAQR
ncbi:MAG: prolipoprotein diacylglyceryl transferase [Bacteriovoracia bacterium]